ncbi:MAG: thioredoxin domain-containing protein [Candidatus Uhrbacteria bacterium]
MESNFIDAMPPRSAFWLGFVTAILSLGTLGFIVLGSCTLKGNCPITVGAPVAVAAAPTPAAAAPTPAAAPDATSIAVSKIPAVDAKTDHIQGDVNAAVTIVEYSDFQCPFCERFHPTLKQMLVDYKGKVRWVYRYFPLSFHPEAVNAAVAAECAGQQGKFWEYGDKLIDNQSTLGADLYKKLAADLGLDANKFASCQADKSITDLVNKVSAGGGAAGVNGTPGSFIFKTNAKGTDQATIIKGAQPPASVKAAIDALLK